MSISIIGCGWLGLDLAKTLFKKNYSVLGTTTSEKKINELISIGIDAQLLTIKKGKVINYSAPNIFQSKTIIITLPFKRSFNPPTIYKDQLTTLLKTIKKNNKNSDPNIIFTSSTSIYPKYISEVTESTPLNNLNPRQHSLLNVENTIKSFTKNYVILRLGGLFGDNRKIGMFLKNKTILENANSPVNLIHKKDVINIISKIISSKITSITLNCACNHHPSKKELYEFHSKKFNTPIPKFITSNKKTKLVKSNSISKILNYKFIYDNLFTDYD
jgi:nucleoside-diphosphate-sugar epimerase